MRARPPHHAGRLPMLVRASPASSQTVQVRGTGDATAGRTFLESVSIDKAQAMVCCSN